MYLRSRMSVSNVASKTCVCVCKYVCVFFFVFYIWREACGIEWGGGGYSMHVAQVRYRESCPRCIYFLVD